MGIHENARICIVGAGPAGLATAHRLHEAGYRKVTVLEKLPQVGGLCVTYEFEGRAFDLGANYVTSAYRHVRAMAKKVGAELYIETDGSFYDTETQAYRSILRTARGDNGLVKFGLDSLRYLWKRRLLNATLTAAGYGAIDGHPELLCTFSDWLKAEGLGDLSTLFEIPITLMGYGTLDEISAPYALTYMSTRTVVDLMIFGSLPFHRWPRRFINGFQRFWERIAEPLDVRTDVRIESIERRHDGVTVTAGYPHRVEDRIEHRTETHEFDYLVVCCPLQTEVTGQFLDLTTHEAELFARITCSPFCVATFELESGGADHLHTRIVNVTPIPDRTSAKPTILTQQFRDDPLVTFYAPVVDGGEGVEGQVVAGVRELADDLGIELSAKPVTVDNFPYFPHVGVEEMRNGWYRRLEAMQGQNRTFYNGGVLAFELIEPIVAYSFSLVDRFFTGPGTVGPEIPISATHEPAARDQLTAAGIKAGFTDLMEEVDAHLEVQGEIPAWVSGGFVRNGTARWVMGGERLNHWFDGTAMLHRFGIDGGQVQYRNRWLRSANYKATVRHGRNMYAQFGTDPKRSFFGKVAASIDFSLQIGNNDFITVTPLGSEWISVGETPTQMRIDIEDLATKGIFRFKDKMISMWTCSHMVQDRGAGRVYNYSILAFPGLSRYRVWHVDGADHRRTQLASVKDQHPSYMHSFGLSERYLVLTQFPLKLDPLQLFTSGFTGRPIARCMRWHEDLPTKTVVLEKATGKVVTTAELPAMFGLHYLNTWEDDGDLVFDIATYENSAPLDHLFFDTLFGPDGGDVPYSGIVRYRVPLDGSPPPAPQRISDVPIEMPRINDQLSSRPYRYAYGQSWDQPGRWYNRLVKIDTEGPDPATNATIWGQDGWLPSEPVFVPRPGATAEDDGVVMSVVLDATVEPAESFLVVLDGASFTELARAKVPHPVPFGLHGEFVGEVGR